MINKISEYFTWIIGIVFVAAFLYIMYATGVHTAREQVCGKVGGVYVQTYTNGWKCINAEVIELK